jgi:hypothetical protein
MLRRYLIVNGATTALLYGCLYAAAPSTTHVAQAFRDIYEGYVMQSPILGPLVNKVVLVISCL